MIPRIIHQTYPSATMPVELAANVGALRAANPGWEHRFYDDAAAEAFIRHHYDATVLAAYRSIADGYGAARADLFRYLLLYAVGGVYLDMKSSTARPLDAVLAAGESFVLAHWPNAPGQRFEGYGLFPEVPLPRGEFQQWHIIAAPRHPFLEAVLQLVLGNLAGYDPARDGVGFMGVLRTTGPIAYTRAICQRLALAPHRLVDTHEELGLVYSIRQDKGRFAHRNLFAHHYSAQAHPLVRKTG